MNTTTDPGSDAILAELLANTPDLSPDDLHELEDAGRALERDPSFVADLLKDLVVEDVLRALEEDGLSQNALAKRMGKSRQYLSKVLSRDRRVNFTLDSLAEFSVALGRKPVVRILGPGEAMPLPLVTLSPQAVASPEDWPLAGSPTVIQFQPPVPPLSSSSEPAGSRHVPDCMSA